MKLTSSIAAAALVALFCGSAQAVTASTVDFSSGRHGWAGPRGITFVDAALGDGAPALHTIHEDFGITYTNSRRAYTGDYSVWPSLTFSVDVLAKSISFDGTPVSRDLVLELRDYDSATGGYPYSSVWFTLGTLDALATPGWQHLSVTIADTSSLTLPPGWGGYGGEDAFGNPILPEGVTFASILKGVDQIALTTLVPGFFYGFTDFDIAIDNIAIGPGPVAPVPEPASLALMAVGGAAVFGLARRRLKVQRG